MTNHTAPAARRHAVYVNDYRACYRSDRLDEAKRGYLADEQYDDLCCERSQGMVFDNYAAAAAYIVSRGWRNDVSVHLGFISAYPVEVY